MITSLAESSVPIAHDERVEPAQGATLVRATERADADGTAGELSLIWYLLPASYLAVMVAGLTFIAHSPSSF